MDNGSCILLGCTDETASNYDSTATDDDGSCEYSNGLCADDDATIEGLGMTGGCSIAVLAFAEFGGCDFIYGGVPLSETCPVTCDSCPPDCTDDDDALATFGGCASAVLAFAQFGGCDFIYGGVPLSETCPVTCDNCDSGPVSGCTDSGATNYDSSATEDDGSCTYPEPGPMEYTITDANMTVQVDASAILLNGSTPPLGSVLGAYYTNDAGDLLNAGNTTLDGSTQYAIAVWQSEPDADNGFAAGEDITWVLGVGGDLIIASQVTMNSMPPFSTTFVANGFGQITDVQFSGDVTVDVPGCTDGTACNYDDSATSDDGSCTYAASGYDCDDNCLVDTDGDGVCDDDEVVGCQDNTACNYDDSATDAGTCDYADAGYDCNGVCLADADGDGVCDEFETGGCTDPFASNYDSTATDDDGSCMSSSPWDVIDTDCNMTVLLPENLDIIVEDEDLSNSIWIGVTNGSGDVVGTVLYSPGEVNAIAVWGSEGEIPGMDEGETLNWIVMNNGEVLSANVSYFIGDGTYNCNSMAGISSLTASSVVTQDISLDIGWNIWSTYVDPEDPNMASMLEQIVGVTIICKNENGAVYWPGFGLNNIGDHTPTEGYQIKMSNNALLSVTGQMIDPNMTFNLEEGWGIIGYVKPQPSDAVDMMFPVVEDLIIMKDENGLVYWPAFGLNSIGNMEPGEGYQVKMFNDVMFSYTSGAGRLAYSDPFKTAHYDTPKNTGNNMTIGLPEIAWEIIPAIGDEIAAYDESGKLIGSTTVSYTHLTLPTKA